MVKIFRFQFNTEYARALRDAVNDRQKQSLDNVHQEKKGFSGEYLAWNRTCAAMDRLEDTINYLNHMELEKNERFHSAFDFYDFINNAYIVIDCIKTIGKIFRVDSALIQEIEDSTSIFENRLPGNGTDQKYFEYIRSLCSVHPLCTNRQKEFLNGSKFHCCPFVSWRTDFLVNCKDADLVAVIYPADNTQETIYHGIYISQFEQYIAKWIDFIPKIIDAKNLYTDKEYERLRNEQVKDLAAFNGEIVKWIMYLKEEYCKRFDYNNDYILDDFVLFFTIKLSNSRNNISLEKYKNAIRYALGYLRNELQNMSYEGYENSGICYPEKQLTTTLFDELGTIFPDGGVFMQHSYALQKVYYLESRGNYSEYEKDYARSLLEKPKELINKYVYFTNTEPDEERVVLVRLALYLDALTRKCFLNKNIPNNLEYRKQILTDEQCNSLLSEKTTTSDQESDEDPLLEIRKECGGNYADT